MLTPLFIVAITFATGVFVVIRSDRPLEIGGMIATPSSMKGNSAT